MTKYPSKWEDWLPEDIDPDEEYEYKVHMNHCNQGEYEGCCKYGQDNTCPAFK